MSYVFNRGLRVVDFERSKLHVRDIANSPLSDWDSDGKNGLNFGHYLFLLKPSDKRFFNQNADVILTSCDNANLTFTVC